MTLKRKTVLITTGAALAVAVGIGGTVVYQEVNERNEAATTSHASLTYEADFSDDANLAGAAEDLFYGKVTALKGQKDLGIGPESQYAVEVQRVFKGDVTGVVVVNQQGGKDENGDIVNLPEGDALLEVGKRYLFATKYNPDHRFNTVIPVFGDMPIPNTEAAAPGLPDANGDGKPTMSDRWTAAVQNQNDLSTAPPDEEPTEEPAEDPIPEPSPTSGS
ncbi:hypothetical protein [Streptomyces coeruleorubidus]|uniref:hypothetical protein n=1 Tax=Streptomyces coeruleorubidus TaxID=116188 RepID=UPI00339E1D36